jgi:hypothetical protein
MAYVQGTTVVVTCTFSDIDDPTLLVDCDELVVTITPGVGDLTQLSLSTGGVVRLSQGKYRFAINTDAAAGRWTYEVDFRGELSLVKSRTLRVSARGRVPA